MSEPSRRLYIDSSPGEVRGVVVLDGRPERLLIERDGEAVRPRLGEAWRGRVGRRSGLTGGAFLDLGQGHEAVMKGGRDLPEGAVVEVEVVAEAWADKAPVAAFRKPSAGAYCRLSEQAPLAQRLKAFAPDAPIVEGDAAREAADLAEEEALAVSHRFGRGAILTIEPTRALVAIDVDLAQGVDRGAPADANPGAVAEAARLLRLKGLGGIVIIDLIGVPKDPARLIEIARRSFQPDQPGVIVGPIGRSGTMELTRPHRETPVHERLLAVDGRPSAETTARRLARRLIAEGRSAPGGRLRALAEEAVARAYQPLAGAVDALLGPRVTVVVEPGRPRETTEVVVW